MGYEIKYSYCERIEETGEYDRENVKTKSKKIGTWDEHIPLDKLVPVIMGQLARRDIWVTKVEIFEFKKTQISFRETKDGIVIKNKKFKFDSENNQMVVSEIEEEETEDKAIAAEELHSINNNAKKLVHDNTPISNGVNKRILKWVVLEDMIVFDDQKRQVPVSFLVKQKGLRLKVGSKYPVFKEMIDPNDKRPEEFRDRMVYVIKDDAGREITVLQDYFVNANIDLVAGELGFDDKPGKNGNNSAYNDVYANAYVKDDMINLRG